MLKLKEKKIFSVASIIVSAFMLVFTSWVIWLFKTRFYINNALIWWVIGIAFFAAGLISYVIESERRSYDYEATLLSNILTFIGAVGMLTILIICIATSSLFDAETRYQYANNLISVVESSEDKSAFPNLLGENNDTHNLPLIGIPEAIKKAETEMGKIPALGSQFELLEKEVTTQNINNELFYVIPLEPKSIFKWDEQGNRGYFLIDRNNGDTKFVETSLYTTEKAPFSDNAIRIANNCLKTNNISGLITDMSPEVDEEGNFHYIATVYTKTALARMKIVKGIVDIDAVTLKTSYYGIDEIPAFVDRVYPESFFEDYVKYYGKYKRGFWNSLIGQKEVVEQTTDMDVIYIDGVCYYYSGITSAGKGESSNGIMMMNSRTGEMTLYRTYGISELKAQGVAEGKVQEKEYKASYPLLLTIAGEETYFMLMRDSSNNLCGYSFVNYKDYTKSAVGENLVIVQAEYIKSCKSSKSSNSLEDNSLTIKKGNISEITSEVVDGTSIYYVRINNSKQIYSLYSELSPEIVFAKVGDSISISYVEVDSVIIAAVDVKLTEK